MSLEGEYKSLECIELFTSFSVFIFIFFEQNNFSGMMKLSTSIIIDEACQTQMKMLCSSIFVYTHPKITIPSQVLVAILRFHPLQNRKMYH